MFVLLKGRSVKEAFQIGKEIASAISEMNPDPVTLKMEKVYHPCFLLTKKRYVGYSFESPDQVNPIFDAKGIETVRRDTCAAVAKAMEQTLRFYFEHQDISMVTISNLLCTFTMLCMLKLSQMETPFCTTFSNYLGQLFSMLLSSGALTPPAMCMSQICSLKFQICDHTMPNSSILI